MPGGLSWNFFFLAFLLSAVKADYNSDLKEGGPVRVKRSGYLQDSDSNESVVETSALEEVFKKFKAPNLDNDDNLKNNIINKKSNNEQDKIFGFLPVPNDVTENRLVVISDNESRQNAKFDDTKGKSILKDQYVKEKAPGGSVLHDELVSTNENVDEFKSGYHPNHGLISKLIPFEEHIPLNKIPGASNFIKCTKEGEFHNLWAPELECMVCVCLSVYGNLRPACVNCQSCMIPPRPYPPKPTTEPAPYTTPSLDEVSCQPLPVNEPFKSPLDPCKICICTENVSPWGVKDVKISCQHNPQCVLPPYPTTYRPTISTPIPLPVCDKFPQNVPFPHPDDPCKTCKCSVIETPFGIPEQQINCYIIPECQPGTEPSEPITELPEPEICDRYNDDLLFPHPKDHCQMCKCNSLFKHLLTKKKITCYVIPDCLPEPEPPVPEPDCGAYPQDTLFPHPWDSCQICKCSKDRSLFFPKTKLICYPIPQCLSTPAPRPTSTWSPWSTTPSPAPTPEPPPVNVRCAPLPVETPFQNPMNPCQICVCTERADGFGRLDVQIDCQENPKCVLPHDVTTLPPDIITPMPLPACKEFPENVPFPHPYDACKLCKCSVVRLPFNIPEERINCYTKPECLSTPAPRPSSTWNPRPTTPSPAPTPEPPPANVRCAPLPVETPFQNPMNPCQICVCTERADGFRRLDVQIDCQENPKCVLPHDVTTLPPDIITPIPLPACKEFPENVPFPHPYDTCKLCKCSVERLPFGVPEERINCYTKPECLSTPAPRPTSTWNPWPTTPSPAPTPEPPPANVRCAPLPVETPFQNPMNPCQICVCTERADGFGRLDVQIDCQENPKCVLPHDVTTLPPDIITPIPLPACKEFPENVPFPHPYDACKLCKCSVERLPFGVPEERINCYTKPECLPTPPPEPPTTKESEPVDLCYNYPLDVFFPHPLDQCRVCICYRNLYSTQIQISCILKPECVPTDKPHPVPTTPSPEPKTESCAPLPNGIPFQNPLNPCQICVCTEHADLFGRHDVQIECEENPQCVLPPDTPTIPPDIIVPIHLPACKNFPQNVFFPHPQDPCQECKCTVQQNQYGHPEEYINCFTKLECLPPQTTASPEPPLPYNICDHYPLDVPFDDPTDECRVCVCTYGSDSIDSYHQSVNWPTTLIQCQIKPECLPIPEPITEEPEAYSFCKYQSLDVPFTDPRDPCQLCVCYMGLVPDIIPGASLLPTPLYKCTLKPECYLPPPEPQTISPLPVTCSPLPTGIPFQNPLNPCQTCVCEVTVDLLGRPDVNIKCLQNPKCVIPYDVTTVPPIPHTSPIPLPACAQFPTNVIFPHPQDKCKLCKCTVEPMPWGGSEQQISCFTNPECEIPSPSTLQPPEPSAICEQYPPNVLFPHPQDPCIMCRCTNKWMPYGEAKQLNCYVNPTCSSITPTTPAPWPPAPPGPLPGPAPHESCSPYDPNQPFQHPWDECQVCVCKEAVSLERITIEVNCYTKASCCIELPFDVPAISFSSVLNTGTSGAFLESGSGLIFGSASETGNGLTAGNLFKSKGEQWRENLIGSSGSNLVGSTNENSMESIIGEHFRPVGHKQFGPPGVKSIKPLTENLFIPAGENWDGLQSQISMKPSEEEKHSGEKWLEFSSGNYKSPTVEHTYGPTGQNWIVSPGEILQRPNLTPYIIPADNQYVSNQGSILINKRPLSLIGPGQWKDNFVRPGQIMGGETRQHGYIPNIPMNVGFPIKSEDPYHGYISSGFGEGNEIDHRVLVGNVQPEYLGVKSNVYSPNNGLISGYKVNGEASEAAHHQKRKFKIKSKSGKPNGDINLEDDEEEIA